MSELTDLLDQTLLGAHQGFERYDTCFPACEGHADPSTVHFHSTPWDFFGELGVTVSQTDGEAPQVSLVDMPHPVASYSPAYARVLAYQILLAADMAERLAQPSPTAEVTRLLAEALRSISG
ncbi:hypothetical protein [Actinocrinis sp.]|uniref:hypothetical protein n=1 Tax=Actinocrinis sp. TaxID=1920516 RepID=UPI002D614DFF|nr:hypothetical protein [Actinocrinis sp.]HZP54988.1 hypothetical protein [Actinocrinis sp.]